MRHLNLVLTGKGHIGQQGLAAHSAALLQLVGTGNLQAQLS